MPIFRSASATDIGKTRSANQDAMYAGEMLLIVADGMGGHAGGEVAAQSAVNELEAAFREQPTGKGLLAGTKVANREVFAHSETDEELHGMGTTLVAAALVPGRNGEKIALMNVGDSRAYLFEDGRLERLTEDHSLVEEMLRQGEITEAAAEVHPYRHVLTRAVGINERVEVDSWTLTPVVGTRLLLCSDGLTNECDDAVIAEILRENPDPADAASALIRRALDHGGNDNITAVVADIVAGENEPIEMPKRQEKAPRRERPPRAEKTPEIAPRAQPARIKGIGQQMVTFRVVLFSFILILVLAAAIGVTVWFDKATYFVGLDHNNVAIYNGRPGGLLWFQPTLVTETNLPLQQILPANRALVRSGMLETSYDAATKTVTNLRNELPAAVGAGQTTSPSAPHG